MKWLGVRKSHFSKQTVDCTWLGGLFTGLSEIIKLSVALTLLQCHRSGFSLGLLQGHRQVVVL